MAAAWLCAARYPLSKLPLSRSQRGVARRQSAGKERLTAGLALTRGRGSLSWPVSPVASPLTVKAGRGLPGKVAPLLIFSGDKLSRGCWAQPPNTLFQNAPFFLVLLPSASGADHLQRVRGFSFGTDAQHSLLIYLAASVEGMISQAYRVKGQGSQFSRRGIRLALLCFLRSSDY